MRRALVVWIAALAATAGASALSLQQVLDRFYEARGGLRHLKAVESVRISGTYRLSGMADEPVLLEWKRPDRLRLEIGAPGGEAVEGFDGQTAWVIAPGSSRAQPVSGNQAADIRRQADLMDGPFVDWKAKGNTVRYLGQGELDGIAVVELGLVEEDSPESTVFLDRNSFLAIRRRGSTILQGTRTDVEIFLEDYKKVDGLVIAHTIRTELIDLGLTQWFRIEGFETNVNISDDRFALPGQAAQP